VLASLKERLDREGPVEINISRHEFEVLGTRVRTLWKREGWPTSEDYVVLGYLRTYTMYRKLPPDDRSFWRVFFSSLDLPADTDRCYQRITHLFESNIFTRDSFITTQGRANIRHEFVKSIDAIWGVKSLNAAKLATAFRRYYLRFAGNKVTPQLLENLLGHEVDEVVLRHTTTYDHIFRSLSKVVDAVLAKGKVIDHLSAQELTEWLLEQGVILSEPNAIEFFYNKTETALVDLIHYLRGTLRIKSSVHNVRKDDVSIALEDGFFYEGEPIELEFGDVPETSLELKVYDWQGEAHNCYRFSSRSLTLYGQRALPIGGYWTQVFSEGEPVTLRKPLHVLPALKWEPNIYHKPLIENAVVTGRVSQENGSYFGLFRWQPQWHYDNEKWQTKPAYIEVELDAERGLKLEAEIVSEKSFACRFVEQVTGQALGGLETGRLNEVVISQPTTVWNELRAYLESRPEYSVPLKEDTLSSLASLVILEDDVLVVEKKIHSTWHFFKRIPVRASANTEQTLRALCKRGLGWGFLI
jgi:hypothetical protein